MEATGRAAPALALLLLAPGLAAAGPAVEVAWPLVPANGPAPGGAVAAFVALRGPPGLELEAKAWLEGAGVSGSQTWTGTAWERSDRYHLRWTLGPDGRAEAWVAVRAAAVGAEPLALGVRVRAGGAIAGEALHGLAAPEGEHHAGLAPGAVAVGAWEGGRLVALAPAHPAAGADPPWDLDGRFALRAPAGARLEALAADGRAWPLPRDDPAPLRIVEALVDPRGADDAEYVRVGNPTAEPVSLVGWWLRGPGWTTVARAETLGAGAAAAIVRNVTAYAALAGRGDAVSAGFDGTLQLPNAGGEVVLGVGARAVDVLAWGSRTPPTGWQGPPLAPRDPGLVLRRLPGWPDTDAAPDWDPAPWRAGWAGRAPLRADAEVVPFARGEALATALAALAGAQEEILVEVYAFTHPTLAAALHAALARGVRVRVLAEGAPVGGLPPGEAAVLDALAAAGADVARVGGSGRDRYATVHAKVAVVDRREVLLGSENWTPSGFPEDGRGNLGWGLRVRSAALARELAGVWSEDADAARGDVQPWMPRGPASAPAAAPAAPAPAMWAPARVTLLLAPDNARPAALARLDAATTTIDVEALQLPAAWGEAPNPVVEALQRGAERGARVRVLLDGAPGSENRATVALLNAWAAARELALEARLASERVHNKGLVLDGAEALVGSLNFGEASMTWNREAALLVEGPSVGFFAAAFEADWAGSGPRPGAGADPALLAGPLVALVACAVLRARRGHAKARAGKGFR